MTEGTESTTGGPGPATARGYGVKTLLSLAWPVVIARSTHAVIGFSDALMTAPLGEAALAAVTTGAMDTLSIFILPMGLVFIVQSFASQLFGKGDLLAARRYAWYGLIISAVTMVLAMLSWPIVDLALGWLPFEDDVGRMTGDYIFIRLFAIGPMLASEVIGNWYGGLGNTRLHMVSGIIAMVINVFCNWLLITGNLGAPALGVEGAALASLIASWIGFGFLLWVFLRKRYVPGTITGRLLLTRRELWRMIRFGAPNGLSWFLEFSAFALFINVVVAYLGTTPLAAMMVVMSINSVSFMPAFGITSSGAILVGQAIGSGDLAEVGGIVRRTASVTAIWQGSVALMYLCIPGLLIGLFTPPDQASGELLAIGTTILALSAAWQLFDSVAMTLSEALRAAGDTAWSLWVRLGMAWFLFMPLSILTVLVWDGGYVAAVLCIVVYVAVLAGVLVWRFRSGKWRDMDLTGDEPVLV